MIPSQVVTPKVDLNVVMVMRKRGESVTRTKRKRPTWWRRKISQALDALETDEVRWCPHDPLTL